MTIFDVLKQDAGLKMELCKNKKNNDIWTKHSGKVEQSGKSRFCLSRGLSGNFSRSNQPVYTKKPSREKSFVLRKTHQRDT